MTCGPRLLGPLFADLSFLVDQKYSQAPGRALCVAVRSILHVSPFYSFPTLLQGPGATFLPFAILPMWATRFGYSQ